MKFTHRKGSKKKKKHDVVVVGKLHIIITSTSSSFLVKRPLIPVINPYYGILKKGIGRYEDDLHRGFDGVGFYVSDVCPDPSEHNYMSSWDESHLCNLCNMPCLACGRYRAPDGENSYMRILNNKYHYCGSSICQLVKFILLVVVVVVVWLLYLYLSLCY